MAFCAAVFVMSARVDARVARFEVLSRTDVAYGYERIVGKLHLAEKPGTPANARIVDLGLAQVDAAGEVEATADVEIVRPKDPATSNGAAIVEVNNRGGKGMVWHLNEANPGGDPATPQYWGDGFLERHGFTMMWVGWQWDVPKRPGLMGLDAPILHDHGRTITGFLHSDFHVDAPSATHEIGDRGHTPYLVASENDSANVLTERDDVLAPRHTIARSRWHFVNGDRDIALDGGFVRGKIYELVYRAKDPVVTGFGFAAERDAVAWLKHDPNAPVHIMRAYGYGISQSARFLRQFLYDGFNADENGNVVFDGFIPIVSGAALGGFNVRFGQPSRDAAAFSSFFYPVDIPPFDDARLLAHGGSSAMTAKVMYIFTSHEYYGRVASLMTTSDDGKRDLSPPGNVRYYAVMGGQHVPRVAPVTRPGMRHLPDPLDYTWLERSLLVKLDAWVRAGASPPPSRYPRLADRTLVAPGTQHFPSIPNVATPVPAVIHRTYHYDFGPAFPAAVTYEPPRVGTPYPLLVPASDEDGNDRGGLRLPDVAVPLATYTGWNLRTTPVGFDTHLVDFFGSFFPFAQHDSAAARDPRWSITARYGNRATYLRRYDAAVNALIRDGYLLPEDAAALHAHADALWTSLTTQNSPTG